MKRDARFFCSCLFALILAGLVACAGPTTKVVLLPQPDGSRSAVVVTTQDTSFELSSPYQAVKVSHGVLGGAQTYQSSKQELSEDFGALFRISPEPAKRSVLYFEPGGSILTPESQSRLAMVAKELGTRAGADLMVVGHTDSVGPGPANDALSRKRAEAVVGMLIKLGIPARQLEAVGRGERELLVPTQDEVDEPKNRRVEIVVY